MDTPSPNRATPSRDIADLIDIMAKLRTPVTGCPWDLQQDFRSIAPYTIEEAYEVADAIARGDMHDLCDELGDLLLQVVYHARMAEEQRAFSFGDVVEAITGKMIRRHPHVFADADGNITPAGVKSAWEQIKAQEKAERAERRDKVLEESNLLADVKSGQPALAYALLLQKRAASIGFDWDNPRQVLLKIREEVDEVEVALDAGDEVAAAREVGDLLFATVNLARHMKSDPEFALRETNQKFLRRFGYVERTLEKSGRNLAEASLDEMEALWREAKMKERSG